MYHSRHTVNEGNRIENRRWVFCRGTHPSEFSSAEQLITTCNYCLRFFVRCCRQQEGSLYCHHDRIIFVNGACIDSGRDVAAAGIGGAYGTHHAQQVFCIPVTDDIDQGATRSAQRAELLAALQAVNIIPSLERLNHPVDDSDDDDPHAHTRRNWIIATNSDYLYKGITEWLPRWKQNRYRNPDGGRPSPDLDLFLKLEERMTAYENEAASRGSIPTKIGFWRISKESNKRADMFAKVAAMKAKQLME